MQIAVPHPPTHQVSNACRPATVLASWPTGRLVRWERPDRDDVSRGIWRAEKPGFRYRRRRRAGRGPCVQRPDQRAGVLPRPGEGPAASEQQPAAERPGLQGPQHNRPKVLHVLREQPSLLRARPRKYLLIGLRAQVRPVRDRDHVVAELAQFRCECGREHLVQQQPGLRPLVHAMSRCWTCQAASARAEASSASAISASISSA